MRVLRYIVWFPAVAMAVLLPSCSPGNPTTLQPMTVGIDIRGGNNNHNPFTTKVELALTGTTLEISGKIPYVDVPPTRLAIREGNLWAYYQNPGTTIAQYTLDAGWDDSVDLAGTVQLTEAQATALRQGRYYIDVDTSFPALGAIVLSEDQRVEGGTIQVNISGLPEGHDVWVKMHSHNPYFEGGPGIWVSAAGYVLTDLYYGVFEVEPPVLEVDGVEYMGAVTPGLVTVGPGLRPVVEIVFSGG